MSKSTLSLAAALMLSASALTVTAAHAQSRDDSVPKQGNDVGTGSEDKGNQSKAGGKDAHRGAMGEGADKERAAKDDGKGMSLDRGEESYKEQRQDGTGKHTDDKSRQPSRKSSSETETKTQDAADAKKNNDEKRDVDAAKRDDRSRSKQSANDSGKRERAKSVDLSGDKKDRLKTSFKSEKVKPITNVNVDVSVGRRLPRDWDYRPVPQAVVAIVPEYSGYRYVYVEDRYVIVDPDSYEVVYVLEEAGGGSSASVGRSTGEGGADRCSTSLTLSEEDRTFVFEKVRTQSSSVKVGNLEIGVELPSDTRVETFPSEVTTRVTKLDGCRYVFVDDKIAVVDPSNERIVAFIEH